MVLCWWRGQSHPQRSLPRANDIAAAAESQVRGREFSVDTARVLSLASRSGCSTYDCEFAALAHDLGVRLVSNDAAVLRAFPEVAIPLKNNFAAAL